MNILFYYPSNKRTNAIETLLENLVKKGMCVLVLTTCGKGDFHFYLESIGIPTYTHEINKKGFFLYYLKHILFLIKFCKKNKIEYVFSNLQHVNFISVLAQFFSQAKFIIFRHHFKFNVYSNDNKLDINKNEVLFDKIINRLAKIIIVPSSGVFNGMVRFEKANQKKIKIIPYIYNFGNYVLPDMVKVEDIKHIHKCKLLLLMCSRLIKFKRHYLVFPIIKKLVDEGFDVKMIVLDEGHEKETLSKYIVDNHLTDNIFLLGFKADFINYMAACDLLIHPSLTEASNSTVKEMGLLKKAVAVCSSVGDFDDYIIDEYNGFLMSPNDTEIDLEELIRKIYKDKEVLTLVGENLHSTVMNKFNQSDKILEEYLQLIN